MSRQRTINDQRFWRSPLLIGCTTEDKVALLHLLTCPDSNVIGAYSLIPRIAGAEIGWTPDQWLQVMDRLATADLALYDIERMFVWVRIWWEHHQASQSMGPKLRGRTLENLRHLPEAWLQPFLADFRARLSDELRSALDAGLAGAPGEEAVSVPYGYPIDTPSTYSTRNSNANENSSINVTPTLRNLLHRAVDKSGIPAEYRKQVEAAITKAQSKGIAKADTQAIIAAVAKQFQSDRPPRDVGAYTYSIAQSLPPDVAALSLPSPPSKAELAGWNGRCFCWPTNNPTNFMRIEESGHYEQISLEGGTPRHGYAPLGRSKLLVALREGRLQEVSPAVFANAVRGARS